MNNQSSPLPSLPQGYHAVIIGASGAIGQALHSQIQQDPRCGLVLGLHRHSQPAIDFNDEASIIRAGKTLQAQAPFHLIINAAGLLHTASAMPEKRLSQLNYHQLEATFRANTFGPALLLAHFSSLLPRNSRSLFAMLSARVGSIGDNRLGGWYSYRASKAALNMLVRTAAIELARTHPQAVITSLHPGTVTSALSAPFGGDRLGQPPAVAAGALLRVLDQLTVQDTGNFYAYDGKPVPW